MKLGAEIRQEHFDKKLIAAWKGVKYMGMDIVGSVYVKAMLKAEDSSGIDRTDTWFSYPITISSWI